MPKETYFEHTETTATVFGTCHKERRTGRVGFVWEDSREKRKRKTKDNVHVKYRIRDETKRS